MNRYITGISFKSPFVILSAHIYSALHLVLPSLLIQLPASTFGRQWKTAWILRYLLLMWELLYEITGLRLHRGPFPTLVGIWETTRETEVCSLPFPFSFLFPDSLCHPVFQINKQNWEGKKTKRNWGDPRVPRTWFQSRS